MVIKVGYDFKVVWVEGDDVIELFKKMVVDGYVFKSFINGMILLEWGYDLICV